MTGSDIQPWAGPTNAWLKQRFGPKAVGEPGSGSALANGLLSNRAVARR